MGKKTEWISRAECGRRLEISAQMIGRHCRKGAIPTRADGKVPWPAAKSAYQANVIREMSGSYHSRASSGAVNAKGVHAESREDGRSDDYARLDPYICGAVDFANALRHPSRLRLYARMAVALGCSAAQSYGIAQAIDICIAAWQEGLAADALGQSEADAIFFHPEDESMWAQIAQSAGEAFDLDAWKQHYNLAMQAFDSR
ncbi:MAG: hypothetical protein IT168_05940 [Bryobacterales bacterium]|nr:hypothetical protein [Bryobacterales bacterium]